jgi:hypothetical protein
LASRCLCVLIAAHDCLGIGTQSTEGGHQRICRQACRGATTHCANFLSISSTNVLRLAVTVVISMHVRKAVGLEVIGQVSWAMALGVSLVG